MKVVIDKNKIPIPEVALGGDAGLFPVLSLKVGESFFVSEYDQAEHKKLLGRISGRGAYYGKGKRKFVVRSVDGGIRCWRSK